MVKIIARKRDNPTDKQLYWRAYQREYHRKLRSNPQYRLRETLKAHGLTPEQYQARLQAQHGVCAFCGGAPGLKKTARLVVDHDHITGAIRGLIHFRCNILLGYVRDNPETIAMAVRYLKTSNVKL